MLKKLAAGLDMSLKIKFVPRAVKFRYEKNGLVYGLVLYGQDTCNAQSVLQGGQEYTIYTTKPRNPLFEDLLNR